VNPPAVALACEEGDAMAESWDSIDRYMIISSDCHAGADLWDYKQYLPRRFHDEFDVWASSYESPFDDLVHHTALRNWDNDFRLAELDADGISAELLIPNTIPPFFPTTALVTIGLPKTPKELKRRTAGIQAHNRWVVDFCGLAPKRRRGVVQIFPNDIDAAIAEIRWAHETGAFGGVLLPPVPPGHVVEPYFHTKYDPLWAVCEELNMPLCHHAGLGTPEMPMDQPASKAVYAIESLMWARRTLAHLLLAGVFERFPDLKFVPTETGVLWALQVGAELDGAVATMKTEAANRTMIVFGSQVVDDLRLTPTEYIRRNCWFGASGMVPKDVEMRHEFGIDHLMWGNDYPHEEGTTPESLIALRWLFADVPVEECRQMFAGNIAGVYGFDLDALAPVAKRVGPLVSDVHTPLSTAPDSDNLGSLAGDNIVVVMKGRPFAGGSLLMRSREAVAGFAAV
jgi:predicted TIM-barrel fold metal-dependent hydrolase